VISPTVSVVMPTYNRRELLPRVIAPLLGEPDALEVIVVVDGARDGSLELLEDMARRDGRLRPVWTENAGMVQARLHGAGLAHGEIVLLLDDDVELEPGAVAAHARAHRDRAHLVAVGAMPVAGGPQQDAVDYPRAMYAREYLRHVETWIRRPDAVLGTLWEGNLSIRRDDLLALGPPALPEIGRAYHCDVDFGLRCESAGLQGRYIPDARGVHHFARTPAQFVADARSSGRGLLLIHAAHPDQLGPFRERQLLDTLPAPVRPVVALSVVRPAARRALAVLVAACGRLRVYRPQRLAAAMLRVTEQLREIRRRTASGGAEARGAA
jgi:glycosyltransferase involved in cell wall biosynthesis